MSSTSTAVRMSPAYVPRSTLPQTSSRPCSPGLPPAPAHLPPPPVKPKHPSSAQHHRSASTPLSPGVGAVGAGLTPRMADMERRGSSNLRHEVTEPAGRAARRRESRGSMSEGARAILTALSRLPAPLPETLPPTFLPSPNPTPSPPDHKTFADYARSPSAKRKSSIDDLAPPRAIGLGLGLTMTHSARKRKSPDDTSSPPSTSGRIIPASPKFPLKSPELYRSLSSPTVPRLSDRSITPSERHSPKASLKRDARSSLRSEITDGMGAWTKDQFVEAGQSLRARALLLKRHGDAYSRSPTAQPQYVKLLPADRLRGLLCLTDAVLLWLFAYWLEEQVSTRIRASPYNESQPLREFVRKGWESEMRKAEDDESRERAKAMVGLMHLIEAVICYHLNSEQLAHLSRKTKELSQSVSSNHAGNSSVHGPSPTSSSGSPAATGPSPAAHSTTSQNASGSPESHTSQYMNDLLPIISNSTSSTHRAHQYLLNSRHHLSLRVLRTRFPETFEAAIHSELADEALPAPGDVLGSAKTLDIDRPDRFAWPIELGMHCPVGHTAVFGRSMVSEYGRMTGGWELKLEGELR